VFFFLALFLSLDLNKKAISTTEHRASKQASYDKKNCDSTSKTGTWIFSVFIFRFAGTQKQAKQNIAQP